MNMERKYIRRKKERKKDRIKRKKAEGGTSATN